MHSIKFPKFSTAYFVFFITLSQNLFGLPIDLSDGESKIILPSQVQTLELYNFRKNTTYVLHVESDRQLEAQSNHQPIIITEHNSLLIENEDQLDEKDVISLNLMPPKISGYLSDTPIQISKVVFRTDQYPNLGNDKWGDFIDQAKDWLTPGEVTQRLIQITKDHSLKNIFTVGCESGKDPLYWVEHGADVTILDGTPHAVSITSLRLADKGALNHLKEVFACILEEIPDDAGIFDAVTGTAAFPFIPPHLFKDVMEHKIFSHVAPSGYFAGHFFGPEHAWATDDTMTFVSADELVYLFIQNGFEIVWLDETKKQQDTVFDGPITWHEIKVIARKVKGT